MRYIAFFLFLALLGCATPPLNPPFVIDRDTQEVPLEQMHEAMLEFRHSHGRLPASVEELITGIKTVYSHAEEWDRFNIVALKHEKAGKNEIWAVEIEKNDPRVTLRLLNSEEDTPIYDPHR
ncbi:MAG: hypothetical protein V4507_03250 [Verrucomicrobiota bacterium]